MTREELIEAILLEWSPSSSNLPKSHRYDVARKRRNRGLGELDRLAAVEKAVGAAVKTAQKGHAVIGPKAQ